MRTEIRFIDQELTSWGGIGILKKMIDRSGFASYLERLPLPLQGSNRGYPPVQLFLQFMSCVWCGADRYAHLDITRLDHSLQRLYGWKNMPDHKAFERYFRKFDIPTSHAVFGSLYRWFFSQLKFDNFTMDIDSSVLTRYGEQEGSAKGYNRHKPGRKSQHPMLAVVADIEMAANFWLRSGDAHTSNNFKAFLEETLHFLQDKKIGLLRLDSGFYSEDIFDCLEKRESPVDYIVSVPMYVTIQRKLKVQRTWLKIDNGIEITEFEYQAQDWEKPRRMVAVRQLTTLRPKATGKQLTLFADEIDVNNYGSTPLMLRLRSATANHRYSCYITTLKLSAADVWRLYRQRANCENRIKELKYDYGLDKMNQASFDGTEASLMLMTIAYNFLSLFKQLIMGENVRSRLKTLRNKMLAIPAIVERSDDKTVVKMALHMNRRAWINKLCQQVELAFDDTG
jgi:hypothetical protein